MKRKHAWDDNYKESISKGEKYYHKLRKKAIKDTISFKKTIQKAILFRNKQLNELKEDLKWVNQEISRLSKIKKMPKNPYPIHK